MNLLDKKISALAKQLSVLILFNLQTLGYRLLVKKQNKQKPSCKTGRNSVPQITKRILYL